MDDLVTVRGRRGFPVVLPGGRVVERGARATVPQGVDLAGLIAAGAVAYQPPEPVPPPPMVDDPPPVGHDDDDSDDPEGDD